MTISWAGRLMPRLNGLITPAERYSHDFKPDSPDSNVCLSIPLCPKSLFRVDSRRVRFSQTRQTYFVSLHNPLASHLARFLARPRTKTKKKKKKMRLMSNLCKDTKYLPLEVRALSIDSLMVTLSNQEAGDSNPTRFTLL